MSLVLVRAAAGCGKTTELACRYLAFVAQGVPVERAIAITFTRKAAAELVERVTLALKACLVDHPEAEPARRALGPAWPRYREVAPTDPEVARRALASLPSAPIGTTDRFVHALLTEHALDAAMPIPGEDPEPIDVPILPTTGLRRHLDRAARRVLDPPGGGVDPDVALLTRYFDLGEILGWLSAASPHDLLPVARTDDVMGSVAGDLAAVLRRHDVPAAWGYAADADVDAIRSALERNTNDSGSWAVQAIAGWLAEGLPDPAPFELAGWLYALRRTNKARKAVRADLETTWVDLGPARLTLAQIVDAMRYPYDRRDDVVLADRLQSARERLRVRVVQDGLRGAARAGELDHTSLTIAAIALCQDPPARLRGRYAALLVDEVQDANQEQLALYRAIAQLPSDPPVQTVMVGDLRQSIYLFRGAEPAGFSDLLRADRPGTAVVDLTVNHRSHDALVRAHRELFAALDGPLAADGFRAIDDLSALQADPGNAALALDPAVHQPPEPVWIVVPEPDEDPTDAWDLNRRALHAFHERVRAAWTETGRASDTAAVLVTSWRRAQEACAQLRAWAGTDDAAYVDGGGNWLEGVVGTDLRMLLRALLDPTDDVAWLALWKHPMVGLTDGALARVRAGVGLIRQAPGGDEPAVERCRQLGGLLDADALIAPHDPRDVAAFARVRDPLRRAREGLGREDLAGVIDRLAHALEWRVLLEAGPGGDDDVAALEVALDLIRELEAQSATPDAVLAAMQDKDSTDLPRVRIDRPTQAIGCTTIHQAKGLAWDHVCLQSPGASVRPNDGSEPTTTWMAVHGEPHRIVGLKFDPRGALSPYKDPVGRLGSGLAIHRQHEECARMVYVAITRARRSVTFGLPTNLKGRLDPVQRICAEAWARPELAGPGVAHVPRPPAPEHGDAPTGWVAAAELGRLPPPPAASFERRWTVRQPSSYASHHDVETRRHDAERFAHLVRLATGLVVGGAVASAPEEAFPQVRPWEWGELAHGWLARWRFRGPADPAVARAWLSEAWQLDAPAIAAWLVSVSRGLESAGGPLWDLVTHPKAKLWFEHPFVGVAGRRDDVLVSGRMDLLVQLGGKLTVIDFKAGAKAPTGWDDLVEGASLRTYGPQLEAYRSALLTAGHEVDRVALWFVRTGTSVFW